VPVARVRAGDRHRAADEVPLRRQGDVHPPGGLRGQRRQLGPAPTAAPVQPAVGAVAVRGQQAGQDHRAPRGLDRREAVRRRGQVRAVRKLAVAGAALGAALLAPAAASAHGLVQREQLPIPQWLFAWAAAAVLVISFFALAVLWPQPRLEQDDWRPLPGGRAFASLPMQVLCGAIGVGLWIVTVLAGYIGSGTALDNWAPTFILITFWVGMVFVSILFGDVYRAFSPFRALGRLLPSLNRPYPERVGRWPAAIGLFLFTWIELVSGWGEHPARLVTAVLGYTVLTLAAQVVWGVERWHAYGEAFGVYYNLFSRMSIFEARGGVLGHRRGVGGGSPL